MAPSGFKALVTKNGRNEVAQLIESAPNENQMSFRVSNRMDQLNPKHPPVPAAVKIARGYFESGYR